MLCIYWDKYAQNYTEDLMQDKILVITYNLSFIVRRLEKLIYDETNYEIEQQIKIINKKIYEISDALETIEVLLE